MELFQTRLQTAFNVTEIAAEGKKRFEGSRQIRRHIRMCEIYFGRVVFCDIQPLERKKLSNLFFCEILYLFPSISRTRSDIGFSEVGTLSDCKG